MKDLKPISKFLSMVLRHKPESIGVTMDEQGWVAVDELLERCRKTGKTVSLETLREVVRTNDKKRFVFSADGTKIRASQGHSVNVDLLFESQEPLEFLYHGTVAKSVDAIMQNGLQKMDRTHVHLSKDVATAKNVGRRRGKPLILKISAVKMYAAGHPFYLSENGVWLSNGVPPEYIELMEDDHGKD